jgi:predicted ATPase
MARIDRLEEETRRTFQLASVIGRTFYYRVLERVSGTQTDLIAISAPCRERI